MDFELLIVGYGGGGQTYFMQFCKDQNITTNNIKDIDGLKHLPSPKGLKINVQKCIYIYNDPYFAMRSHFRRGWAIAQIRKLGNPFKLSGLDYKYENFQQKTMEYKKDIFGIETHFENWITEPTGFPILFLDFNEIVNNHLEIDKFLNRKLDYSAFNIDERHAYDLENCEIVEIYDTLYNDMKRKSEIKNQQNKKNM